MSKPPAPLEPSAAIRNSGDEAAPGSEQTGENICPVCNGGGRTESNAMCTNCGGTGKVIVIVGDA